MISARIITAGISMAYCSSAYLLHGLLLNNKNTNNNNNNNQTLEHTMRVHNRFGGMLDLAYFGVIFGIRAENRSRKWEF